MILADEVNRTPPKTQAAMLEAMQERQVSAGGTTHKLPLPFFVLATQNPLEQEGTYPLPEAQLDRFLLHIKVGYPSGRDEWEIARRVTGGQSGRIGGADDGAQNHLEGDLGHFRADRKLGTHRPPGDIGGGEFAHHRRLAGNGLSRERRHHQAAPIAVDVTVDDEHRTLAEDLSQHRRIRLAGMKYRRITGEDGLDVSGVGQINQRPHRGDPHGEHIAVAALVGGHQSGPVVQQQCCLNHAGQWWTRRQLELG
jgi:hypothetical protein